jgi:hypothetical protein
MPSRSSFLLAFVLATSVAMAQPTVNVYWNENDRRDRTIDFGVTLVGLPVSRTVTIENGGNREVSIPQSVEPFFIITNDPATGAAPNDPNKEEFTRATGLPLLIPAGETRTLRIDFLAFTNQPLLPPDKVNQALLSIRVVFADDVSGPGVDVQFVLRALKTRAILASTVNTLNFDSVYVNPRPAPPEKTWSVQNVTEQPIPVVEQRLALLSSSVGTDEFVVDRFSQPVFGPRAALVWDVRYSPINRGADSAQFTIVYRPQPTSATDSLHVLLRGVGVEQRIELVSASGDVSPVRVSQDTIDFGDVSALGPGCRARLIFRNRGNLRINVLQESIQGAPRDVAGFAIERPLTDGGAGFAVGAEDTVDLRFAPNIAGAYQARLVVETDLRSRAIYGVPDGAQAVAFVLKGVGRRPQIELATTSIDFGPIVLMPACNAEQQRTLEVRNLGNAELRIDSITFDAPNDALRALPTELRLLPAERASITLFFTPGGLALRQATMKVFTNADERPFAVECMAQGLPPDTTVVRLPPNVRSRPGSLVNLSVGVTGSIVARADRATFVLAYDHTMLRFRTTVTAGTASAESVVKAATEVVPGRLLVELEAPRAFLNSDTLIRLVFDTFLGQRASAPVSLVLSQSRFGNGGCDDVLVMRPTIGNYSTDSVCGLDYKTVISGSLALGVLPNPSRQVATIVLQGVRPTDANVRVIDQTGRVLWQATTVAVHEGLTSIPVNVSAFPAGHYSVVVSSGFQHYSAPLLVMP